MTDKTVHELAEKFAQHREGILRFWTRAKDDEIGGFLPTIESTGKVLPSENRPLLSHARQLYNYSEGIKAGLDFCIPYAEHLHDFLVKSLRTDGGWYTSLWKGELWNREGFDTYMNLFVVIGMARYAAATKRSDILEEAWRLFRLIEEKTICGELSQNGVLGCWNLDDKDVPMGRYAGNSVLHYLEAMACLRDAGIKEDLSARVDGIQTFFYAKVLDPEYMLTYDKFDGSFDKPDHSAGVRVSLAHGLEWVYFFRCFPSKNLKTDTEKGLLKKALDFAVQPDGLFQDAFYFPELRTAGGTSFWPQTEAVAMFHRATKIYGDEYREPYEKLARYYLDNFVDTDGGVFAAIDRNGVVLHRTKGMFWKCDYHSMRMCVECAEAP